MFSWKNIVSQNAKRRLHFMIQMQYEFYLILLSGFRDPAPQRSIGGCIIWRTELLPFVSVLHLIATTYASI